MTEIGNFGIFHKWLRFSVERQLRNVAAKNDDFSPVDGCLSVSPFVRRTTHSSIIIADQLFSSFFEKVKDFRLNNFVHLLFPNAFIDALKSIAFFVRAERQRRDYIRTKVRRISSIWALQWSILVNLLNRLAENVSAKNSSRFV